MKKGEDVPGKFAFLASFFGTLFLVMIGYGLYSVYRNQITTGLLTVLDLLISAVAFTGIMHTQLIGPKGVNHVKQILDGFSTKGSPAILTGYATATVAGVGYGVVVGGSVAIAVNLPWAWRLYKNRPREEVSEPQEL